MVSFSEILSQSGQVLCPSGSQRQLQHTRLGVAMTALKNGFSEPLGALLVVEKAEPYR